MCIATIIFEDVGQNDGKFNVNVNVEGATDGFASAAHITAMFISDAVTTPMFGEGASAYGQAKGFSLRHDNPQRLVLILTDVDLEAGSFDVKVEEAEDAIIDGSSPPPTSPVRSSRTQWVRSSSVSPAPSSLTR
jgi:hypothetical protein